jgi:hypothetical protein
MVRRWEGEKLGGLEGGKVGGKKVRRSEVGKLGS